MVSQYKILVSLLGRLLSTTVGAVDLLLDDHHLHSNESQMSAAAKYRCLAAVEKVLGLAEDSVVGVVDARRCVFAPAPGACHASPLFHSNIFVINMIDMYVQYQDARLTGYCMLCGW